MYEGKKGTIKIEIRMFWLFTEAEKNLKEKHKSQI